MKAEEHEGKALPYVLVKPDAAESAAGYPLVIFLHGFGASMYDLAGLSPSIDATGYVYAYPNAPLRVPFGGGQYGYSWAMRENVEPLPETLPPVDELITAFFEEIIDVTGAEAGRIVLGGFSQGGGMTLRIGLPRPDTFAGLVVLSGAFRDPDEVLKTLPDKRELPIFVAHGTDDPVVSIERGGRQTKAFLEAAGYTPVYKEYPMAHEIPPSVVRDLTPWLHQVLPPRGSA
jgi:phospholipase/carboxylesterase